MMNDDYWIWLKFIRLLYTFRKVILTPISIYCKHIIISVLKNFWLRNL